MSGEPRKICHGELSCVVSFVFVSCLLFVVIVFVPPPPQKRSYQNNQDSRKHGNQIYGRNVKKRLLRIQQWRIKNAQKRESESTATLEDKEESTATTGKS